MTTVFVDFSFEAAHRLPRVALGHKCSRLHGHSYRVTVHVHGHVDAVSGWVIDFGDVKKVVGPVIDELDHRYLNELEGLENPTAENLAHWIWSRIARLPGLCEVVVHETCTAGCSYTG